MNTQNATSDLAANALATLAKALDSGDSQALTNYLTVMARFHSYSWNNSLLIAVQRPAATRVAGFHTWLRLGRHVRKGEKGIAILAPVLCKVKPQQEQSEHDDQTATHTFQRLVGFRTAYVFDIAQTEGQELPQFASVKGDPDKNTEALKSFISARAIALDYDQAIAPARGVSRGGRITLLPGLPAAEEFSTLVHELAHELLHRDERRPQTNKTVRETEAEAVAFVVCQAIGFDNNTAAADYIRLYSGDAATLAASLHFIQSTATEILTALGVGDYARRAQVEA
jgi:antirestriction protein ArdC